MVEDVLIDVPKEVFRRFRQLGVYQWPDVLAVAKGDAGKPVMAFRFGHTELFDEPVPWDTLQEVLKAEEGKHSQIVTVTSISPRCFFRLYELGRGMR